MTTTVERDDKGYWLLARDGKRVERHGPFPTPGAMRAWEALNITTGVADVDSTEDTSDTHEDSADSGKRRNVRRDDSMA